MIFLETFITQLGQSFSGINPAVIEIFKILIVSTGWIGGLAFYMWRREKNKANKNAAV